MAYTREQWEQRIKDACAGRYEFLGWVNNKEYGWNKKALFKCFADEHYFSANPNNIENGKGCPSCARKRIIISSKLDKDVWEQRIIKSGVSGGFRFVNWLNSDEFGSSKMVILRCNVDGSEWLSTADNIVTKGRGCPQCSGKRRWTSDERIEQINSLENIEFISWDGEYKNCYSRANVKCTVDKHVWRATVDSLVNSVSGCPKCAKHGYDPSKTGYLYALRSECGRYVKVGISNEPKRRHKELERSTPFKFNIVEQIPGDGNKIRDLEKRFHQIYKSAGFVEFQGCTEWLICTPELLEELRNLGDK